MPEETKKSIVCPGVLLWYKRIHRFGKRIFNTQHATNSFLIFVGLMLVIETLRLSIYLSTNLYVSLCFSIKDTLGPRRLPQIWKLWYVLNRLSMGSNLRTLRAQQLSSKCPKKILEVWWSTVQTCIARYFTINESVAISRKNLYV